MWEGSARLRYLWGWSDDCDGMASSSFECADAPGAEPSAARLADGVADPVPALLHRANVSDLLRAGWRVPGPAGPSGASRTGLSIRDWLVRAREAGLDSIPGTAAEILDDEVRWILTKGKLPTATWLEVVTTAHEVGLRSSSTMMYGHVDNPRHWVGHLRVLSGIQDQTRGFTEFVPLPFVHHSSPIYLAGVARPGPTMRDNLAVHAMARIMLHGRIDNIQTSWVKLGEAGTQAMLRAGANDIGGTLMEETISRMAGSEFGSSRTVAELTAMASGIGRPVRQRTTTYGEVDTDSGDSRWLLERAAAPEP